MEKSFTDARKEAVELASFLHSNRSAAYASIRRFHEAVQDAARAIDLRPDWSKAYSRLAIAHVGLGRLDDAFAACKKGVEIDPDNDVIKSTLAHAFKLAVSKSSFADTVGKLKGDPIVAGYLKQKEFLDRLQEIQENPSSINMTDERVMRAMGILLNVKTRQQDESSMPEPSRIESIAVQQIESTELQASAMKEKDAGNAAYGKKDYECAIRHYTHGLELVGMVLSSCANTSRTFAGSRSRNMPPQQSSNGIRFRTVPSSHSQRNAFQGGMNSLEHTCINENEIRVTSDGNMQSCIGYAISMFQERGSYEVVFKATGRAISKLVLIVELTKRKIVGLHQNTAISSVDMADRRGSLGLEFTRHVSMITITLSKKELDTSLPGYQSPLPGGQVSQQTEFNYGGKTYTVDNRGSGNHFTRTFHYPEKSPHGRGRNRGIRGRARVRGNGLTTSNRRDEIMNNGHPACSIRLQDNNQDLFKENTREMEKRTEGYNKIVETNHNKYNDGGNGDNDVLVDDDECIVLEKNPFEEEMTNTIINLSQKLPINSESSHHFHSSSSRQRQDEDELFIISERGKVACRDYPHARHLCGQFPFDKMPHEMCCPQCFCFVCDTVAPCKYWIDSGHCHATEHGHEGILWKTIRIERKAAAAGTSSI